MSEPTHTETVDESAIEPGDRLLMFASPFGTAHVFEVGPSDVHGYRLAKLVRPFVYSLGCTDDLVGTASAEVYSVYLRSGRTLERFVSR